MHRKWKISHQIQKKAHVLLVHKKDKQLKENSGIKLDNNKYNQKLPHIYVMTK